MRKIDRTVTPDCLREHAAEWTGKYVAGRRENKSFVFQWYRKQSCYHGAEGIRAQLNDMTQGHCAFCDGLLGVESTETVEHFRPKSHFPELAYDWENLFPCCVVCQGKGQKFDDGLLKPDVSDYDFNRYFINNYHSGKLEPNPTASAADQQRAQITLTLYALNQPQRKKLRLRVYKDFLRRDETETVDDFNYRFFLQD